VALYESKLNKAEHLPKVEKHFHDHDEIWIVLSGSCKAFEIDHQGNRKDFELNANDV
jgi:mannose-6-phosphate isomerase-like protein (cupin superfamily)